VPSEVAPPDAVPSLDEESVAAPDIEVSALAVPESAGALLLTTGRVFESSELLLHALRVTAASPMPAVAMTAVRRRFIRRYSFIRWTDAVQRAPLSLSRL